MEENKVATKLRELVKRGYHDGGMHGIADAILQSPDLRVTLIEPKYSAFREDIHVWRVQHNLTVSNVARFYGAYAEEDAISYANSKEPK